MGNGSLQQLNLLQRSQLNLLQRSQLNLLQRSQLNLERRSQLNLEREALNLEREALNLERRSCLHFFRNIRQQLKINRHSKKHICFPLLSSHGSSPSHAG